MEFMAFIRDANAMQSMGYELGWIDRLLADGENGESPRMTRDGKGMMDRYDTYEAGFKIRKILYRLIQGLPSAYFILWE